MHKLILRLLFMISASSQLMAQSYSEQILNKEQFKSAVSLTQDYDHDGDLDIIVSRWDSAGIYVLENDSTRQFKATPIITENLTFYIADIDMADFDNDGDMDYVVCFTDVTDGELSWFQRQDNGTYQKWTIATNKDFIMADVGDFNSDGWIDIVGVGLGNSDEQGRMYINQTNLFFAEEIIATNGITESVNIGDVDGDGDIDIAFGGSGTVFGSDEGARLLINDGNANFSVGTYLHCWGDNYNDCGGNENIEIVDLNGDGTQDILAFSVTGTGGLYWLDGSNNYDQTEIDDDNLIDIGGNFVVFDIDGNGLKDIVRQSKGGARISILYQYTSLQFTRQYIELNWDNCCNPTSQMSFGDLDNDGDLDLVFPEQGNVDEDISWFENINGQLYKHQISGELDGVRIPKMVDWDNDGDLDIFATVSSGIINDTEDELILYENIDGKNFINWRLHDALDHAADVEFADIDGDGDLDAFATARDADDLVWLRNDGFQANWVTDTIFPEGNQPLGIASDDLDDDGDADVVMCSWNDDKVFGFLNNGSGSFSPIVIDANIDGPKEVEIADLDNDGDKDLAVVATESDNSVVIYLNDGSLNFTKQILYTDATGQDIEIVDWDNDNDLDIFTCFTDSDVHIIGFINEGGNYKIDTFQLQNNDVLSIKLSDLDGDHDIDIISGHDGGFTNSAPVLYANLINAGEIEISVPLAGDNGDVTGIDVGDVNNDDRLDIVYADFQQDDLVLLTIDCILNPTVHLGNDTMINQGELIMLDASGNGLTYLWSTGDTTSTIAVSEAGNYSVTVTNTQGCTATDEIEVSLISGTNDFVENKLIVVYPNPTKNNVKISIPQRQVMWYNMKIVSSNGTIVLQHEIYDDQNQYELNIDNLPPGLYLIVIRTETGLLSKKIIKY